MKFLLTFRPRLMVCSLNFY